MEYSSGKRQRLGGLSKQGNPLLRFLWGEAGRKVVGQNAEVKSLIAPRIDAERSGKSESGRGSQTRDPVVDHVAGWRIDYNEFCRRGQMQQETVVPVRGCQKCVMVRKVTAD